MSERQVIDARGAFCPGPLMELIAALKLASVGDEIEVWSSDQGSIKDIPEWIKKVGHELVGVNQQEGYAAIVVKKVK
jgi:tRNA 2-thiouridine synthesizing protein A